MLKKKEEETKFAEELNLSGPTEDEVQMDTRASKASNQSKYISVDSFVHSILQQIS